MPPLIIRTIALIVLTALVSLSTPWNEPAHALTKGKSNVKSIAASPKYAAIVIDVSRNKIIYRKNSKARRHPASLTKMMTLYLVFDALKNKKITMSSMVPISRSASKIPPSRLAVASGDRITVKEAINALIVKSANNVSYALAEKVAGSESRFVALMNRKAQQLSMHDTHFANSHGWHTPEQYTTAYDMALLGLALQKHHPERYAMFAADAFDFRGQKIKGHNALLKRYKGTTGIKTGYVTASGFNLVTAVKRPHQSELLAVVMGGRTAKERDDHMISLLDRAYTALSNNRAAQKMMAFKEPKHHSRIWHKVNYSK